MADVDVKYDEELVKCIKEVFINRIVPENFLLAIHDYDCNVLTVADIQRLRKSIDTKSTPEVNYDTLLTMKNYKGWFKAILNICKDSRVKQDYLVKIFEDLKKTLDDRWYSKPEQIDQINFKLQNLALASDNALQSVGLQACASVVETKSEAESAAEAEAEAGNQTHNKAWEIKNGQFKGTHINDNNHLKKAIKRSMDASFETQTNLATGATTVNNNYYILNGDGTGRCKICNDLPFTSRTHANQHLEGSKHNKKVDAFLNGIKANVKLGPNKEIYVINEHGKGFCYVCDVSLTSKENAEEHLEGRKHKKQWNPVK